MFRLIFTKNKTIKQFKKLQRVLLDEGTPPGMCRAVCSVFSVMCACVCVSRSVGALGVHECRSLHPALCTRIHTRVPIHQFYSSKCTLTSFLNSFTEISQVLHQLLESTVYFFLKNTTEGLFFNKMTSYDPKAVGMCLEQVLTHREKKEKTFYYL